MKIKYDKFYAGTKGALLVALIFGVLAGAAMGLSNTGAYPKGGAPGKLGHTGGDTSAIVDGIQGGGIPIAGFTAISDSSMAIGLTVFISSIVITFFIIVEKLVCALNANGAQKRGGDKGLQNRFGLNISIASLLLILSTVAVFVH